MVKMIWSANFIIQVKIYLTEKYLYANYQKIYIMVLTIIYTIYNAKKKEVI